MSDQVKENEGGRSRSTASKVLSSLLQNSNHREESKKASPGSRAAKPKQQSRIENSKLNASMEKNRQNGQADTSLLSGKKIGSTKGPLNSGSANGTSKGANQLAQLKSILEEFKGQKKEKKTTTAASGLSSNHKATPKGRQSHTGSSNSVNKLNTSLDRSRLGQKSVDLKNKLSKAIIDKSNPADGGKKTKIGAKRDTLNNSSSVASDLLNKTAFSGVKMSTGGTPKPKSSASAKLGSKMIGSKSASKMNIGAATRFGRTLDIKTEEDSRKDISQYATESTQDNSRKKQNTSSTSKINNRVTNGESSLKSRPKRSETSYSRNQKGRESPSHYDTEEADELEESGKLSANGDDAPDFKKKPVNKNAHKLSSLVTQVKPGHMFNETSKKQIDLDKEIRKVHTPRGDEHITGKDGDLGRLLRVDSQDLWRSYYIRNLIEHLKNEDDSITMVKIYKEHFYQTVQSILFLQNVEKIDDNLLVEKKVYLPPNILSRLI